MHIVLDLQGLQNSNIQCLFVKNQLDFIKSILKINKNNTFTLLLNGNLIYSAEQIKLALVSSNEVFSATQIKLWFPVGSSEILTSQNIYNRKASALIKDALIQSLKPDILLLTNLAPNLTNDIVLGTPNLLHDYLTVVLYESYRTANFQNDYLLKPQHSTNENLVVCYKDEAEFLKNADQIFCLSELSKNECILLLGSSGKIFSLASTSANNLEQSAQLLLDQIQKIKNNTKFIDSVRVLKPIVKQRLAYVSPLPPERSGIANYSAELLPELAKYYHIDVIVNQEKVSSTWINQNCVIANVEWFKTNSEQYDKVLYHFGNSIHFHSHMLELLRHIPGIVVLHDFYLSGMMADIEVMLQKANFWSDALYYSHGYIALHHRFTASNINEVIWKWPCSLAVLQNAKSIIVHSEYSKQLIEKWFPQVNLKDINNIQLLREPAQTNKELKDSARLKLALDINDFVVCSFGILADTKLNHRLLEAWLESSLLHKKACTLILVGDFPTKEYSDVLTKILNKAPRHHRIHITGWVDNETYKDYLNAADIGVQLRTNSRGETSAAVLDCMNYGLPTIINANGSMAALEDSAVYKLDDNFTNSQLTQALEDLFNDESRRITLATNAQAIIHKLHDPAACTSHYVTYLDEPKDNNIQLVKNLAKQITALPILSSDENFIQLTASALDRSMPKIRQQKQIFVDVSGLCLHDLKTGIERVVRAILNEWLLNPPAGYRVEPVYANNSKKGYQYARAFTLGLLNCPNHILSDETITYQSGDHFIGIDFVMDIIPAQREYFKELKTAGVNVKFVVYDLLPILNPTHYLDVIARDFPTWLEVVCESNGALCISNSVAQDLAAWIKTSCPSTISNGFEIDWFHLGADIEQSFNSTGLPSNTQEILFKLDKQINFLMVGTLESRKGHQQVLDAFELLRQDNLNINLIFVGKEGWKVESLITQIKKHPLLHKNLFWLNGISDEYLEKIYEASTCLIAASYNEGFGLPLIEAAQHHLPIMARDTPIFKEVVAENGFYFSGETAEELALAMKTWIHLYNNNLHPKSTNMPWLTWKESATQLIQLLLKKG